MASPIHVTAMNSRRRFVLVGLVVTAAAGTAAVWRQRRSADEGASGAFVRHDFAVLDRAAPGFLAAIIPVLLAASLPSEPAPRKSAIDATCAAFGHAVAGLPPQSQHEIGQLFDLLGIAPARWALARVPGGWSDASPAEVDEFLARLRDSRIRLLRSAYDALHQITFAAWYANPQSWPAIGYPGPPDLG